ncbi:HD domain-containing protein [Tenacibaculum amylolyticum]|uniref:HD domain-containing protein n=1 Tax=Tenacibaculum amylolyticum TaxID=104269 RepID=UPI0038932E2F
MTQELYQEAMKFAGEKHSEQKVPGTTANYLLHISNVAMEVLTAYNYESSFDVDTAIQVAILHDTIEDTATNFEEIAAKFGTSVAEGVQALTKNETLTSKKEMMLDSLERINSLSKEIGLVKIADRITNLQKPPKHWSREKVANYCEEAKLIAKHLTNKNEYLNKRLNDKIMTYETMYVKS